MLLALVDLNRHWDSVDVVNKAHAHVSGCWLLNHASYLVWGRASHSR